MVLTVEVSLQYYTTEEFARKLGRVSASQIENGIGDLPAEPIDKVHVIMQDTDGNDLGLQTFA